MFLYERALKEEQAVQSLLAISQNDEKSSLNLYGPHPKNKSSTPKQPGKNHSIENHLSGWQEKDVLNFPQERKEQKGARSTNEVSTTSSKTSSTIRSTRFKNKLGSAAASVEEKFRFYHFDNAREYITQYREAITFSALLDYRNSLLKNCSAAACKKCDNTFDLIKHCQCPGNSPASSSVCYVETQDCLKKHNLLSAMETLRRHTSAERDRTKFNNNNKDKKNRKLSPANNVKKLWPSSSGQNRNAMPNDKGKKSTRNFKNKSLCNVRLKTGNESPDLLRIYTSPKTPYGPRMGSNRPPVNDASEMRGGTPTSQVINFLRPKVPQAAIPNKSTSFQACIMPMSATGGASHSKTP